MTKLTAEAREAILKKAISRGGQTLRQVAKANNIARSTLTQWMRNRREGKPLTLSDGGRPPNQKLPDPAIKHVLAAANLDPQALGAYCREQGIYSFQLEEWRNELMNSSTDIDKKDPEEDKNKNQERNEIKALRDQIKLLKKDLHRKDQALAEATALLVLKKKAHLIWGDPEDD